MLSSNRKDSIINELMALSHCDVLDVLSLLAGNAVRVVMTGNEAEIALKCVAYTNGFGWGERRTLGAESMPRRRRPARKFS